MEQVFRAQFLNPFGPELQICQLPTYFIAGQSAVAEFGLRDAHGLDVQDA